MIEREKNKPDGHHAVAADFPIRTQPAKFSLRIAGRILVKAKPPRNTIA